MIISLLIAAFMALAASGCTTAHSVRTIGKDNWGIEASLGGPMLTNLGPAIPAPNIFVGARYGLQETIDVSAAYNITSPIIPGMALDLVTSVHWVPVQPGVGVQRDRADRGGALGFAVSYHWFSDFQTGFVVIPAVEVASGFRYRVLNPFIGASVAFNFYRPFNSAPVSMVSPFVGSDFIFTDRFSLSLRVTFFDMACNYYGSQVEWVYLVRDEDAKKRHVPVGVSLGFSFDFIGESTVKTRGAVR